ncbi:MAG: xanthine dehydrogenase family protein molybdopterin-binding subunit [Planctomycetaceae bacterium]|nr:xanthine dehydrogenase family protein molybdopterin-binding subunit [Planctomycetaceae bacterium]
MAERTIAWPKFGQAQILGKDTPRVYDGAKKALGLAKYAADMNTPGTLFARLLTSPHAHAIIKSLNVEPAKQVPGVKAVHVFRGVDTEVRWEGELIVAVAAERPEQAEDGLRAIAIEYEVLPHWVDDFDLAGAEAAKITDKGEPLKLTKSQGNQKKGDVEAALQEAKYVHKGTYGSAVITHMCLEPHGSHCEWKGDQLISHLSTQNVSGTAGQFAGPLGIEEAAVSINCEFIGGGFGSKFAADEWGIACAQMAKETGRPVRLMLDRGTELKVAGNRPSSLAEVTVACDADGKITAWDSNHWGTNGTGGGTVSLTVTPYVYDPPNRRRTATGIVTHTGPQRAWRAPNHPQACAYTQTAIDDLAAVAGIDSLSFVRKNLDITGRPAVYAAQLDIAAKLMDWQAKWHPRGKGQNGSVKTGLGLALHTWGGAAHAATCLVKVHPDGTVETFLGSQDIGTGIRTSIGVVAAETFGIPMTSVRVHIGSNKYPKAGPSGGSTTIGGVSGPVRRASQEALWQVLDKVAAKHSVDFATLAVKDSKVWSGDKEVCTWKQACSLLGPMGIEVRGEGPKDDGLTSAQVGGVQMAEVEVDTETGIVRMKKMVAIQDIGLVVNRLTAKSQVLGSLIMGIAYALSEERIMDPKTGRFINADLENYKLPRIGDVGELVVEFYEPESEYSRGVIGIGEPPVISPGAAISNAVANAIGVRVPILPLTPKRVLDAMKGA